MTPENDSYGKDSLWLGRCSGFELKNVVIVLTEDLSTEREEFLLKVTVTGKRRALPFESICLTTEENHRKIQLRRRVLDTYHCVNCETAYGRTRQAN